MLERLPDDNPEPVELMARQERCAAVRGAVAVLPAPERQAVALAFFGELTRQEVAATLHAPLGTTKTRVRRGLLKLRVPLMSLVAV